MVKGGKAAYRTLKRLNPGRSPPYIRDQDIANPLRQEGLNVAPKGQIKRQKSKLSILVLIWKDIHIRAIPIDKSTKEVGGVVAQMRPRTLLPVAG